MAGDSCVAVMLWLVHEKHHLLVPHLVVELRYEDGLKLFEATQLRKYVWHGRAIPRVKSPAFDQEAPQGRLYLGRS